MTLDQQIEMFQVQACWLEREHLREMHKQCPGRKKLREIRARNQQLNREFEKFWERIN